MELNNNKRTTLSSKSQSINAAFHCAESTSWSAIKMTYFGAQQRMMASTDKLSGEHVSSNAFTFRFCFGKKLYDEYARESFDVSQAHISRRKVAECSRRFVNIDYNLRKKQESKSYNKTRLTLQSSMLNNTHFWLTVLSEF